MRVYKYIKTIGFFSDFEKDVQTLLAKILIPTRSIQITMDLSWFDALLAGCAIYSVNLTAYVQCRALDDIAVRSNGVV